MRSLTRLTRVLPKSARGFNGDLSRSRRFACVFPIAIKASLAEQGGLAAFVPVVTSGQRSNGKIIAIILGMTNIKF